jgi:hypothetical protein
LYGRCSGSSSDSVRSIGAVEADFAALLRSGGLKGLYILLEGKDGREVDVIVRDSNASRLL